MWTFLANLKMEELDALLTYSHPQYQLPYLMKNWKQSPRGFRLAKNVTKIPNCETYNPRISGGINFKANQHKKNGFLATEVIICTGKFNCSKVNGDCKVKIRLQYTADSVTLSVNSTDHGVNFCPKLNELKLSKLVRLNIKENDGSGYGTTPYKEFFKISKDIEKNKKNPFNSAILPSKKQVANILHYGRTKGKYKNEIDKLSNFIENSSHVIFSQLEVDKPLIIVLAAREATINEFITQHRKNQIFGIDTQYSNNSYRLPLTVMCGAGEANNTIPTFLCLSEFSDTEMYSSFLSSVINFLSENYDYELNGYIMHDKCDAEFTAAKTHNLISLLCEFHLVKLFEEKLPKYFEDNDRINIFEQIKKIQRADTEVSLSNEIKMLKQSCRNKKNFGNIFTKNGWGNGNTVGWISRVQVEKDFITPIMCASPFLKTYCNNYFMQGK